MIAAHEEMLAIVNDGAGGGIAKRPRSPAEVGFLFKQTNSLACLGQRHPRGQSGETTANDENIV